MKENRLAIRIRDLIIKEEWNIAIRPVGNERLWQENGCQEPFQVLPNSVRYWAADPFVISHKGKEYLFFEMFDRFKSKGLIGCREIENGNIGKMRVVYEAEHHLSFPFVFEKNGIFYMMPEYSEGKCLKLLKAEQFPYKWAEECEWMPGKRVVDSVLLEYNENKYLFTQEFQTGYFSDALDIYILKENGWNPHGANPVITSSENSRLAGKVFSYKNELFRVAQDCSEEYGKQICFNRIDLLNEQEYHEQNIKKISVSDIRLKQSKRRFAGIHTYNADAYFEVIDLKNPDRIKLGNILNIIYRFFAKLRKK